MGIVTVDREISQATTLQDALRVIGWSGIDQQGLMRVIAGRVTGWLAISDGFIRGAFIASSGEKGLAALNQLLSLNAGMFNFSLTQQDKLPLAEQDLRLHIDLVVGDSVTSVPTNQPTKVPQLKVPQVPGAPARPQAADHRSLTADQLTLLEAYRKLTGPLDRAAFLMQNTGLARMFDEDGMTSDKRSELESANFGASEETVLSFLEFHRKVLGDAAQVTETQITMLRDLYRELQTEEKRRVFLAETGMLDEFLAVERGEGLWEQEQEERLKAHDAIRGPEKVYTDSAALVAVDADTRVQEVESLHTVRQRRRTAEVVLSSGPQGWWMRPEILGITVSVSLIGTIAYLVYAQVVQSSYVEATKPEEDMISMDLILEETLDAEIPRVVKNAQIVLLVEGGGQAGQGASGASAKYWSEKAEIARRMMAQGRFKEATTLLSTVIQQDPYDVQARESLVEAYLKSGQRNKAREVSISGLTYARQKDDRQAMERLFKKCIGD